MPKLKLHVWPLSPCIQQVWTYHCTRTIFISKHHQHRARVETDPWEESDYKLSKRTSLTGLKGVVTHCNWQEATEKCCIVQHFGNMYWHALSTTCSLLHNKSDWSEQHFSMHMVTTRWLQCNLTVEGAICKTSWWFISLPCASLPSSTRNILHNILVLKFTQIQLVILLKKQLQIVPFFAHLPISRLLAGRHPGSSHRGRENDSVCLLESLQTPWRLSLRLHGS